MVEQWINKMSDEHVPAGNGVEISTRMDLTKIHRKRLYRLSPEARIPQKPSNILRQYPALREMDQVFIFNTFCLPCVSFVIGAFDRHKYIFKCFQMLGESKLMYKFLMQDRRRAYLTPEKALAAIRASVTTRSPAHIGKTLPALYDALSEREKQSE